MDINFTCDSIHTEASTSRKIFTEIRGIELGDVLDNISLQDIIEHYGVNDLLDQIGVDEVKGYFNLTEKE